ncbi:UDP-N-acetylglucosamine--N-acetylmuramyl-(pentapeptide) pyrophosphoryl-undecaprenol N-acetylglucosamine transferase [Candidatus Bipolaricaulota bacterium]|nr:UDP-N-acetylglucosamine--N-acetylmuramyl-(pentapeptide) pyrophosphoryl-undecaprenol N-acetylglucosamine transferase [Candidatus Bipolaricaulota bacterium]
MRILVAGGGTGGHFYPALAMCEGLKKKYPAARFTYIGTRTGVEARVLPDYDWIAFHPILASGIVRGNWTKNVVGVMRLLAGFVQTVLLFLRYRPQLVIGVGGYSSFGPVILGAFLGRVLPIRTAIHEQNVIGGLANRWLSRFVDLVMLSFPQSERSFPHARKTVVTGNPIREEFLHVKRSPALYRHFGLEPNRRTILVFGGSKGATEITEQVLLGKEMIARNQDLQILLITGDDISEATIRDDLAISGVTNIVVKGYVYQMGAAFAIADLVVCRAGATSLAEITSCGKASMLVPWKEAADDHQRKNAEWMEEERACIVAGDDVMVHQGLVGAILGQMDDELGLERMAGNAMRMGQRSAESAILGEIHSLMRGGRL